MIFEVVNFDDHPVSRLNQIIKLRGSEITVFTRIQDNSRYSQPQKFTDPLYYFLSLLLNSEIIIGDWLESTSASSAYWNYYEIHTIPQFSPEHHYLHRK